MCGVSASCLRSSRAVEKPARPVPMIMIGSMTACALVFVDPFEVFLRRAAVRAGPVIRQILPFGAGWNVFLGQAFFLVVLEAADDALPYTHGSSLVGKLVFELLAGARRPAGWRRIRSASAHHVESIHYI